MTSSDVSPEQISEKIRTTNEELNQIIRCIATIELYEILDDRCYTSLDVIEGLNLIRFITRQRLTDGVDDWKNDHKNQYESLFNSIREQTKDTISSMFVNKNKKTLRFVHSFNILVIDRLFLIFKLLGPTASLSLLDPFLDQLIHTIENTESHDNVDDVVAKQVLAKFRKALNPTKSSVTKAQRLEMIKAAVTRVNAYRI